MSEHDDIHHDHHDDARFRPDDRPRLGPLSKLDEFEVADGYRDPRGWRVLASDGTEVGKVHDLIVDTGTMHTRYLDVRLDHDRVPNAAGRPSDDYDVLVPIGAVQLASDDETAQLPSITPVQLVSFPLFNHGEITAEYENAVLGGAGAAAAAATANAPAAPHPVAAPALPAAPTPAFPPNVPANLLNRDDVTVERRAVEPHEATEASMQPITDENEVRIPIASEETVTRPVVREEIVIRRNRMADRANVDAAPGTSTGDASKA